MTWKEILLKRQRQDGTLIRSYIYAGGNRLAMIDDGGNHFYYHNDHLGTPLAMTDAGGTVVWKAAYDPFGEAQVDSSSTITNNFRFPGQYYDEESGLHYNYHRYYDPRTGRYVTADPMGGDGGVNLFVYVSNNPLDFIDPLGLMGFDSWPFNGNLWPGYTEQDGVCSSPAQTLIKTNVQKNVAEIMTNVTRVLAAIFLLGYQVV